MLRVPRVRPDSRHCTLLLRIGCRHPYTPGYRARYHVAIRRAHSRRSGKSARRICSRGSEPRSDQRMRPPPCRGAASGRGLHPSDDLRQQERWGTAGLHVPSAYRSSKVSAIGARSMHADATGRKPARKDVLFTGNVALPRFVQSDRENHA